MTSRYEVNSPQRRLWDSLPAGEFLRIDELSSFGLSHSTVLLKIKPSLESLPLGETQLGDLPFGVMHAITCASLVVAYQVTVPTCHVVSVGTNFAAFGRKLHPALDVQTYVVDKRIAVVGNPDAMLVVSSRIYWTEN